jgi:hypothetical protein
MAAKEYVARRPEIDDVLPALGSVPCHAEDPVAEIYRSAIRIYVAQTADEIG